MNVTEFEDSRWKSFDQPLEFRHKATLELIDSGTVVDLGCGDGLLLAKLKEKGITGLGLDISPEAVEKCHARGLEAQIHSFDDPIPHPDNSFDTVVLLDVLEHVYDPLVLLKEALRVSSQHVIVGVPNFSSLPARVQTMLGRVPENNEPNKGHVYWFNDTVLKNLVTKANAKIVEKKMNTFSAASMFGESVVHEFPNLLALSFVVKLEKAR